MAYEVTATRKRPQLFDSLAGQEFVVSTIKNAIGQGRIAHAYLFSGPRGVGKTSSARILAKALNCEQGPTPNPCGVCSNCREITQGNSIDVIEIDGASNTSVNDVRVIKDEVLFPPQSSRYKIYIIDEVHMLSTSAFNALLKTIEEPPAYVVFIFATTETQKVPATIRSRCQQFHFQLLTLDTIKTLLENTAKEMGVEAEDDALFWIAKESTGSMRDAYTLFDQVVSFSNGQITMDKIQGKLGLSGTDRIGTILVSLQNQDTRSALYSLEDLLASGVSVEQCTKDFAEYFRTLLLLARGIEQESLLGMQKQRIPEQLRTGYTSEQLEAAVEMFLQLYRDIRFSLGPKLELELAVCRLAGLPNLVSSVTLLQQLAQIKQEIIEGTLSGHASPKPQTTNKPVPKAQPAMQIPVRIDSIVPNTPEVQPPREREPSNATPTQTRPATVQTPPPQVHHQEEPPAVSQPKPVQTPLRAVEPPMQQAPRTTGDPLPKSEPVAPPKWITKDILPLLVQEFATERDPAGVGLSHVTSVVHDESGLTFTFGTRYALETAKQKEEKLRSLICRATGYEGPLKLELQIHDTTKPDVHTHKTDTTVKQIAALFRGEILE